MNSTFRDAVLYFSLKNSDKGEDESLKTIKECTEILEVIAYRLEKEIQLNPIKILGIPLNMQIIAAIQTSLLSLVFVMINRKTGWFSS